MFLIIIYFINLYFKFHLNVLQRKINVDRLLIIHSLTVSLAEKNTLSQISVQLRLINFIHPCSLFSHLKFFLGFLLTFWPVEISDLKCQVSYSLRNESRLCEVKIATTIILMGTSPF